MLDTSELLSHNPVQVSYRAYDAREAYVAKAQIIKLSPLHEQIALSLIQNPGITNSELSRQFGRSEVWISIVRNSDCFRLRMNELFESAEDVVIADIPTKLRVVADMALDRVAENLVAERASPSFALNTLREALDALGYKQRTPAGAIPAAGTIAQQNNFFVASREQLETARSRLQLAHEAPSERQLLPVAELVPTGG